ncbi:hypothetical protein BCR44DRAFT_164984 [Catenaria anguillulae PL171]|uniref:Uncharacterized protein n=1 Tax=Catenaria anguillulae PL171 TaxID=765915 RepID=A0A1Y2HJG9_9FUNG|nr:hypothetical protein BCR44DRAFT_164984 [Catenaria anguillulae PL171]
MARLPTTKILRYPFHNIRNRSKSTGLCSTGCTLTEKMCDLSRPLPVKLFWFLSLYLVDELADRKFNITPAATAKLVEQCIWPTLAAAVERRQCLGGNEPEGWFVATWPIPTQQKMARVWTDVKDSLEEYEYIRFVKAAMVDDIFCAWASKAEVFRAQERPSLGFTYADGTDTRAVLEKMKDLVGGDGWSFSVRDVFTDMTVRVKPKKWGLFTRNEVRARSFTSVVMGCLDFGHTSCCVGRQSA